jgi:nucleoside-diphosphate-sugar epimerase
MAPVFVTGGSGFVGRALIARLRHDGSSDVRALARSDAAASQCTAAGATSIVRGDVGDVGALTAGMRGCDVVFHSAACVDDWAPRALAMAANVEGTRAVLAAARAAGVRRVVHVSTEAVLADGNPIHGSDASPLPFGRHCGIYSESKALAEAEVTGAVAAPGQDAVIVRPRFVWGRGDSTLLPRFVDAMRTRTWIWVDGGLYPGPTCHIEKLLEGMLLAAADGGGARPGQSYFLTDGPPRPMREVVTSLVGSQGVEAVGPSLPLLLVRAVAMLGEAWGSLTGTRPAVTRQVVGLMMVSVSLDDSKARAELGYVGGKGWEEGLRELAEDHAAGKALSWGVKTTGGTPPG